MTNTNSNKMKVIFRKPNFSLFRRGTKESNNVDSGLPSALEELPIEVKTHIASFLSVRDLLKLTETSRRMNKDLGVVAVSSPLTDRASQNKTFDTNYTSQCFAAVIPNEQEPPHSHPTTFAFDLVANQFTEGVIWVQEQDLPANQNHHVLKSIGLRSGKHVATTEAADERKVHLSFFPKPGKFYQFWVITRESQLQVKNMMLHSVGLARKPPSHTTFQFEVRPPRSSSFAVR